MVLKNLTGTGISFQYVGDRFANSISIPANGVSKPFIPTVSALEAIRRFCNPAQVRIILAPIEFQIQEQVNFDLTPWVEGLKPADHKEKKEENE
jgi:hypothetical protein